MYEKKDILYNQYKYCVLDKSFLSKNTTTTQHKTKHKNRCLSRISNPGFLPPQPDLWTTDSFERIDCFQAI